MYGIIAAYLPYVFQLRLGYGLFIGDNRRALQNRAGELLLFYGRDNRLYLLFILRVGGELQLSVERKNMYSAFARISLFQFVHAGVYLF